MRQVLCAFVAAIATVTSSFAQQQPTTTQQQPAASIASVVALDALSDCLKKATTEEILACVVTARLQIKPLHFYTGEYTRFSETDFGPRYDPRNYSGYDPIAADMCKRFAPEIKNPIIKYTEFNSVGGGCCGYGFFVMACVGIN
jgi:hypothetical protein